MRNAQITIFQSIFVTTISNCLFYNRTTKNTQNRSESTNISNNTTIDFRPRCENCDIIAYFYVNLYAHLHCDLTVVTAHKAKEKHATSIPLPFFLFLTLRVKFTKSSKVSPTTSTSIEKKVLLHLLVLKFPWSPLTNSFYPSQLFREDILRMPEHFHPISQKVPLPNKLAQQSPPLAVQY